MKLDLVLCLATAAYAAPVPRVGDAVVEGVQGATKSATGLFQRLGNIFANKEVAAQRLLERKAANRANLPVLTARQKEGLKHLKLSRQMERIEGQNRADELKNRLTKVKELSYAESLERRLFDQNYWAKDLKKAKRDVAELEDRLKAINQRKTPYAWSTASRDLENAKKEVKRVEHELFKSKQETEKITNAFMRKTDPKVAQPAELLAMRKKILQVLAKQSKKVDDLQAELNELINMKGTEGFESTITWKKWSKIYLDANPGEAPDIDKVIHFARRVHLHRATWRLYRQKDTLNAVEDAWRVQHYKLGPY
jgi:hypothetical protein